MDILQGNYNHSKINKNQDPYTLLVRIDEQTYQNSNSPDSCQTWMDSHSNNPIQLEANIVFLNFVEASSSQINSEDIYQEADTFINTYGYVVPFWRNPHDEQQSMIDIKGWVFLNSKTYEPYWNPCEIQSFGQSINYYGNSFWQSPEEFIMISEFEWVRSQKVPFNKETQTFYWDPSEYPYDNNGLPQCWSLDNPPKIPFDEDEKTFWKIEDISNLVLIDGDLYPFVKQNLISYQVTSLSSKKFVFLDHFTGQPLYNPWLDEVEINVALNDQKLWHNSIQVDIIFFKEYVRTLDIPYDKALKKFFFSADEYPALCDGTYVQWTAQNMPYYPDGVPYWTLDQSSNIVFVAYWTYWSGNSFKYSEYQQYYQSGEQEFEVSEYYFINKNTNLTYWDPFRPPFLQKMVNLDKAPINPNTGEPYWYNSWEVEVYSIENYLNEYRLAFDIKKNQFIWGPYQYPTNRDGSFSFWDNENVPVHIDGKTQYYKKNDENIIFLNSQDYYLIENGEPYENQQKFSNNEYFCLTKDQTKMEKDNYGRPIPLNNPFDNSGSVLDLQVIANSKKLTVDDLVLYSLQDYFNNEFYLPYDEVKKKFIWGPGEYPHQESQIYEVWTTENSPVYADNKPYWEQNSQISWKDQESYQDQQTEQTSWETEFKDFATQDYVIASEFQFISTFTLEPFWELFEPPQNIIRPTDKVINPDTGEAYWDDPSEVILIPIKYAIMDLPIPYNFETDTYYWQPGQYPANHDGSYQNWTKQNAPYGPNGQKLWNLNDNIGWVPLEQFYSTDKLDIQTVFNVKEYVFLNSTTGNPYFDVFNPPFDSDIVDIEYAPVDENENPFWQTPWEVWVLKFENYLAQNKIAYDIAKKQIIWEPFDYPQNPDGSFTEWTSQIPPYYPDGQPYWISGSQIQFLNYEQYQFIKEEIPQGIDGKINKKFFVFINADTWQPYWDPFDNDVDNDIDLNNAPINKETQLPYWFKKSEVEIITLAKWIEYTFDLPYDEVNGLYLWTPGQYPQNHDKSFTKWDEDTPPKCTNNQSYYWNSDSYKKLIWITNNQYYGEQYNDEANGDETNQDEDNYDENYNEEQYYAVNLYVFINIYTGKPYFDPFNIPKNIPSTINIYDSPKDSNDNKYWYDVSEVQVVEIYYYVQKMLIPYNKKLKSAYWQIGQAPTDDQGNFKDWSMTNQIPKQWDGTPFWKEADLLNIIWITPEELLDVQNGIYEAGQTMFAASKYLFYDLDGILYYLPFELPNDQVIDVNGLDNPWFSRNEVRIGLLKDYLNQNYYLPYDKKENIYFWLPGEYPVNYDGTYTMWNSQQPPKTPDDQYLWPIDYAEILWVPINEYYFYQNIGVTPLNQKIKSNKIVLYSWTRNQPCVDPFQSSIVETDLLNPQDVPKVGEEKCWTDFSEISVYNVEDYIYAFLKLPFDKMSQKFLWQQDSIPVASDGNIRDWQFEEQLPFYANLEDGEQISYYSDISKISWVPINEFYSYQPEIIDTFRSNQYVIVNWYTLEVLTDPFSDTVLKKEDFSTREDYEYLQFLPIDYYMIAFQKIPVMKHDDGSKIPMWSPGNYPKSQSGYEKWTHNHPPQHPDKTNYWPTVTSEKSIEYITPSEYYSEYSEFSFSYQNQLPEVDYPENQQFSTKYWVFISSESDQLVYSIPTQKEIIVDCTLENPSEKISDCNNIQIHSIRDYLLNIKSQPYNSKTGEPFFEPGTYPMNHDGTFQVWSNENVPVQPNGQPMWTNNVIWSNLRDDVFFAKNYVFINTENNKLWWSPDNAPAADVIQISSPPEGDYWKLPSQVKVMKIDEYYKQHDLPFNIDLFSFSWPPFYYPKDSKGLYSEYSSQNPPIAADGKPFWNKDANIIWIEQNKYADSDTQHISVYSSQEYAILDWETDQPYVDLFVQPPVFGTYEKGSELKKNQDGSSVYLWIESDVYFLNLNYYLNTLNVPVNPKNGKPFYTVYPKNKDGTYQRWSDQKSPVSPDGKNLWPVDNLYPIWLNQNNLNELQNGMAQSFYEVSGNVFLNSKDLTSPYWTNDKVPADEYIYLYDAPINNQISPPKAYWDNYQDVFVLPEKIYNEWLGKYSINDYMFVNTETNIPYWNWESKPNVQNGIIDISNSPIKQDNEHYWESRLLVTVVPKLQWFVRNKIYPKSEFSFYQRDGITTYTVTGEIIDLDKEEAWQQNRNKVKVKAKQQQSEMKRILDEGKSNEYTFLLEVTSIPLTTTDQGDSDTSYFEQLGYDEIPNSDDLPNYRYEESYAYKAFTPMNTSLFTFEWKLIGAIKQDAQNDYLFPCDITVQLYQALYDISGGIKPRLGWGCEIAKLWVYNINTDWHVDLKQDHTWDELQEYAKQSQESTPYEFEYLGYSSSQNGEVRRILELTDVEMDQFDATKFNFTNATPEQLNKLLNYLYQKFDEMAEQYYKFDEKYKSTESSDADKMEAQSQMDKLKNQLEKTASNIEIVLQHLYGKNITDDEGGDFSYDDGYYFDWEEMSDEYKNFNYDMQELYVEQRSNARYTQEELEKLSAKIMPQKVTSSNLYIPPEQLDKGVSYYFQVNALYNQQQLIQNPAYKRVDVNTVPPIFQQIENIDNYLKINNIMDDQPIQTLTSFQTYKITVDLSEINFGIQDFSNAKFKLYFWIYPYDYQDYDIDPNTKKAEFKKILEKQYGLSVAFLYVRVEQNSMVWWGARYYKVEGSECRTLTDQEDYFNSYKLYDLSTYSEDLIDAVLLSYNPITGMKQEVMQSEDQEEQSGLQTLDLCGPSTNICSKFGSCESQQGRKYCKCNEKRYGSICEFDETNWNKMKQITDKIVTQFTSKDLSNDEQRVQLTQKLKSVVQLPGFDQTTRTSVNNKMKTEVEKIDQLDTFSPFFSAAEAIWSNSFSDPKVALSTSQQIARDSANIFIGQAATHLDDQSLPFELLLNGYNCILYPQYQNARRRTLIEGGPVQFTSLAIPGVSSKANLAVSANSPILSKTKSVKIAVYNSMYINSIPNVGLLLAPLIDIDFYDQNGVSVSLSPGESLIARFGMFNGVILPKSPTITGVRLNEQNQLTESDGILFQANDQMSFQFQLTKTGKFSFKIGRSDTSVPNKNGTLTPDTQIPENALLLSQLLIIWMMICLN